jgi:lipid-A-disaccharide synthase-like uncharacterized protein
MGIWTACFFFGQFSSPWFVHKLNDAFGTMQSAFLAMGVLGIVVALVAFIASRRTPSALTAATA